MKSLRGYIAVALSAILFSSPLSLVGQDSGGASYNTARTSGAAAGTSSGTDSLAVGTSSVASATSSTAIGTRATVSRTSGVCVGADCSVTTVNNGIAIGESSVASGGGTVFGTSANDSGFACVLFGRGGTCTAASQMVLGSPLAPLANYFLGVGVTATSISDITIQPSTVTGTNAAPAQLTISGGTGTGTGSAAAGTVTIRAARATTSGTTAHTQAPRLVIVAKQHNLVAAGADPVVLVNIPSGEGTGGSIEYTVFASDGTDHQSRSGMVRFAGVNKASTETCGVYGVDGSFTVNPTQLLDGSGAGAISSNTLTYTWGSANSPTNGCLFTLNAASGLSETILEITYTVIKNGGTGTVVPQ